MELETVALSELHPRPRNYRDHPDDQIEHIVESITEHGLYRNIVVARDNTILAGHGVWKALCRMGWEKVPVKRLDVDPDDPRALKVLTGDNEMSHLGEVDDRVLTELLKEIKEFDDLLGTGFDEMMLANLVYVTRPASEIADFDAAAEWVGMPEFQAPAKPLSLVVNFRNEADRLEFARRMGLEVTDKTRSTWWPEKERDRSSVVFEEAA